MGKFISFAIAVFTFLFISVLTVSAQSATPTGTQFNPQACEDFYPTDPAAQCKCKQGTWDNSKGTCSGAIVVVRPTSITGPSTSPSDASKTNYINPFVDKPTCGFAGQAPQCCTTQNSLDKAKNSVKGLPIPDFGLVDALTGLVFSNMGFADVLTQKCMVGSAQGQGASCQCVVPTPPAAYGELTKICNNYVKGDEKDACIKCATDYKGLLTGIGCVPLDFSTFISSFLLRTGIGLAGVIAMFCIIYSAIMIQSSRGNAERIKKAQEQLTSCVIGLILIIFSIFILRLIGVDILRIPGFS